ncbi:MAG: flagellar assembly protein FliW [Candidatus Eisenbacteria bacterium]|uniref:Flagellar assembly factor FliW n=1 Tax=Eiseniibacteriota bacterium TaxID=2212470 RepID=A0A948W8Q7_UNCEI|nr:flagellar assembly protein FliW [Candidatus Eisenbacteria bacterium]MBU1949309.1 flagellar assembly protein FliW [Candidatus Eisenbacteria bacterium]MBU2692936.1 flagellar assembly protein FliW [Candidatus Eisenbacteria bacterium]
MSLAEFQQESLELAGAQEYKFPDGLLGFEERNKYLLTQIEDTQPFYWLISDIEDGLGFILIDPSLFFEGEYEVSLTLEDRQVLELGPDDPIRIFVIVTAGDNSPPTANLKGPIVFNPRRNIAKQIVLYNPSLSLRAPFLSQATALIQEESLGGKDSCSS